MDVDVVLQIIIFKPNIGDGCNRSERNIVRIRPSDCVRPSFGIRQQAFVPIAVGPTRRQFHIIFRVILIGEIQQKFLFVVTTLVCRK